MTPLNKKVLIGRPKDKRDDQGFAGRVGGSPGRPEGCSNPAESFAHTPEAPLSYRRFF